MKYTMIALLVLIGCSSNTPAPAPVPTPNPCLCDPCTGCPTNCPSEKAAYEAGTQREAALKVKSLNK